MVALQGYTGWSSCEADGPFTSLVFFCVQYFLCLTIAGWFVAKKQMLNIELDEDFCRVRPVHLEPENLQKIWIEISSLVEVLCIGKMRRTKFRANSCNELNSIQTFLGDSTSEAPAVGVLRSYSAHWAMEHSVATARFARI